MPMLMKSATHVVTDDVPVPNACSASKYKLSINLYTIASSDADSYTSTSLLTFVQATTNQLKGHKCYDFTILPAPPPLNLNRQSTST